MEDQTDAPRAGDVGALLRVTRERADLTLRDVAEALRIRHAHLEAIEAGDYDRLPGATYAVGFVRAYADHLGLDSNEIVRRFKTESAIQPSRNELEMPIPVSDGGLPSGAAVVVGLLVIGAIYGAWYLASSTDRPVAEIVQEVPDRFMALLDIGPDGEPAAPAPEDTPASGQQVDLGAAPDEPAIEAPAPAEDTAPEPPSEPDPEPEVAAPAPSPEAAVPDPAPEPEVAETPEPPPAVPAPEPTAEEDAMAEAPTPPEPVAEPQPEPEPEPEVAEPAPAPVAPPAPEVAEETDAPPAEQDLAAIPEGGRVFGEENVGARVVLRAREDSWVQVRDSEGLLLTRLLRAGDSYRVPQRDGLRLMTGNAGGLLIEVDGQPLPPLGGTGEVRRNIPLDAAALQSGDATPN